jgi:predicted DsbA family dithiol-disulfide isomerase
MLDNEVWTPLEIANEVGKSRQFVIDAITGKTKQYQLFARKMGRSWIIADDEAKRFINECRNIDETYTPQDIAEAIGMTRKYVLDALTGYGGRKEPRLAGEKRGDRWVISREEGDRFIGEHLKSET